MSERARVMCDTPWWWILTRGARHGAYGPLRANVPPEAASSRWRRSALRLRTLEAWRETRPIRLGVADLRAPTLSRRLCTRPVRLAFAQKRSDALVRVGHERVHRHHITGELVRRVLVHIDLRVKGALTDADDQRARAHNLLRDCPSHRLQLVRRYGRVDEPPL